MDVGNSTCEEVGVSQRLLQFSMSIPSILSPPTLFYVSLSSLLGYLIFNEIYRYQQRIPKFAGPLGLPVVGNILQIRGARNAAEVYRGWAQKFGSVFQIQLGNIPVLVVNDAAAAKAIFGQTSQALSSRPQFYTFHKILSDTSGTTIGTSPYNESLKRRRKGAASALNRPAVASYVPLLDTETRAFITDALVDGQAGKTAIDPMPLIQRLSLSLGLSLNWGTRLASHDSALFHEITTVEAAVSKFRSTTGNLQDYIPLLRLNPFSGSRAAREFRGRRDVYLHALNRELDDKIAAGTHQPCIQANVILDKDARLNKAELTSISLTMLSGGLDTITTVTAWSVALLAERHDIQQKAYAEIQAVYGANPLCDALDDQQQCPYVVALVKECLRYFSVLRLSLPRVSIADITYDGKVIPADSLVFLNAWGCNTDPALYADPAVFRPERFLEQPDLPLFSYGVGYRMCTGVVLANRELYLIFLRILASFTLQSSGQVDIDPLTGVDDVEALAYAPRPYKVLFVPRDEAVLRRALGREVVGEE